MGAGRPTKYKKEYCQQVIDHMNKGFSFESFAGLIGTHKQTLYNWCEDYPEFLDAKKEAFEKSRFFWEKVGIRLAMTGEGNSTAWIFNMKNRFREDWNDTKDLNHKHQGEPYDVKQALEEFFDHHGSDSDEGDH